MERKIYEDSTTERLHKTIKISLFQTYYKMLSSQFRFQYIYMFIIVYELILNLFLTVFNLTYSEVIPKEYSQIEEFIKVFRYLVLLYPNNNYYFAYAVLYGYFTLFLIQFITYSVNFKRDNYISNLTKESGYIKAVFYKFLLVLNMLYDKVLFHSILITTLSMVQCSNSNSLSFYRNFSNISCTGFNYYFNLSVGIVTFSLFVLISLFNLLFLNDSRPITMLPWSNPNNKIKLLYLGMKFNLSFFYIFNLGKLQFDFKFVLIIIALFIIFVYRFLKPLYHNKLIFNITLYCEGVLFYFAFFSMINKYTSEVYMISTIVFFSLTSLLFGLLTLNIFHRVQNYYKFVNLHEISNENLAFNKIMLLIEDAKEFKINNFKKSIFLGLLQKHRIKCAIYNCQCHMYLRVLNVKNLKNIDKKLNDSQFLNKKPKKVIFDGEKSVQDQIELTGESKEYQNDILNEFSINECVFGIIKIYLEEYIEKFPKTTDLSILNIYLNTYYLNNVNKSLFEIIKIYRRKFNILNEFNLYHEMEMILQKNYRERLDDDIDIENVLIYNNLSYSIIEEMERATGKTIEFWQEIKSSSDKPKIYEAAVEISKSIRKIKLFYSDLINNLGFKDINFFKLFRDFLEKIIFHEQETTELREKLFSLQSDIDQTSQNENENLTTFSNMEDVGSVVISGKSSEIGKILSVNLKFCSIFKYESSQLLNNSINKIMPQYLSQYHDNFMKRYMETAKKNILDQDRILFGLKSTGFIRPILIQVKLIPNLKDNIRFIGLVKKLKKTDNFFFTSDYTNYISTSFIITTEQGNVYGITKNVCENFGIPLNMLLNYKGNSDQTKILNIKTIFPQIDFDDEVTTKGLDADNGKIIKLDSRSLKSFYEDFKETVMEGKNKTFKFLFKKDESSENIFTEHDILLFMHNISFNDSKVNCKVFKFVKLPSLFKMSPIRTSFLEEKNSFYHNTWVGLEGQLLSPLKKENEHYISSNSVDKIKNKIDQDKNNYQENNKYKQNLFSLNSPKQVKLFILVVLLAIILFITISIIELVLTISNINQLKNFFEMWGFNSNKNLYISSLLSNFHNLVLFDNNLFKNVLFPNDSTSYRKFIVTAIEFDINKTIDISNNLTYYINTFDESISNFYNHKRIQTKTIETNLTVNYDYESLSYLENYLMLKIRKLLLDYDSLNLTNKIDILYNSKYFSLKVANRLFKDLYYILENSFVVFRFQIEVLQYNLDMILLSGKLFELNIIDILIYSVFVICFVILMIFILLLTSITNYKIEILKIFFLIDKKWSDIIIRRCKKYLEESREYLQKDNKKVRDKNFFDERDDVEYLENQIKKEEQDRFSKDNFNLDREDDYKDGEESLVRLTSNNINHNNYIPNKTNNLCKNSDLKYSQKNSSPDSKIVKSNPDVISPKKKNKKNLNSDDKSIMNENDNLKKIRKNLNQSFDDTLSNGMKENENEVKQATSIENEEERNRLEHSISNFRRTKWINSFKIFFLLLLICIYFLIVLIMNKDFINDFKQNSYYVTLIGERGWNFNNLLIYFREMIVQGMKKSNYTILDESGLYKYSDLDGLDLYSLYYNKSSKIENSVQSIYNIKSNLLKDFIKMDTILNSKEFCSLLKNYNIDFIDVDEKYCQQFKSFSNINGLSNYIGFITNFCYNNFYLYSNRDKSLNLDFFTITSILRDENLAIQINVNQIIIFRAFLLELNILCDSIISYLNYFNNSTLIRICFFFVLIIFEVSIFMYLANILKKLINEDKAILTIIPSEAISINEKIKNAFQYL